MDDPPWVRSPTSHSAALQNPQLSFNSSQAAFFLFPAKALRPGTPASLIPSHISPWHFVLCDLQFPGLGQRSHSCPCLKTPTAACKHVLCYESWHWGTANGQLKLTGRGWATFSMWGTRPNFKQSIFCQVGLPPTSCPLCVLQYNIQEQSP